jgi:hypothetical protein
LALMGLVIGLLAVFPARAAEVHPTLTITKQTNPDGGMGFPFTLESQGASLIWGTQGFTDGQFNLPTSTAVDGGGNVYVTDGSWIV